VVCARCKGTGQVHVRTEYSEPTGRKPRQGVERVYEVNPGIIIGTYNSHVLEDFGGMPLSDWEKGKPFPLHSENRTFTCPAWWYQSADYRRKPTWAECAGAGRFSACKHFPDKAACWERFDEESDKAVAS